MAFVNAMDVRTLGANGAPCAATTGSALLDLHDNLVRGLEDTSLDALLLDTLQSATTPDAKVLMMAQNSVKMR